MLSASHRLLAQARFCVRTHLPLLPNSTTPTVQVIFRYLRPGAPVFNITTVSMVTFRQSPYWYYPWADVVMSRSSDTQYLWTWWHFGDHTGLINLSVNNIHRIHVNILQYYMDLIELGVTPIINWKIIKRSSSINSLRGKCNLFFEEKTCILRYLKGNFLNTRKEMGSACRRRTKFLV